MRPAGAPRLHSLRTCPFRRPGGCTPSASQSNRCLFPPGANRSQLRPLGPLVRETHPIEGHNRTSTIPPHPPSNIQNEPGPMDASLPSSSSTASNGAGSPSHCQTRAPRTVQIQSAVAWTPRVSWCEDTATTTTSSHSCLVEHKKRGAEAPLSVVLFYSNQRHVNPNVAKNASKSPVVTEPSPSKSAAQSLVWVNSQELSSTLAIGL